ncbi:MAG TPA: cell division protein SepF [Kineosporiaceae bacterium]|nr:cell division protein SepF [Kineosporiaceae bacterium]
MGGALRKTMIYLGLAEDDERYDAYDVEDDYAEYEPADHDHHDNRVEQPDTDQVEERRAAVTSIARGPVARVVPGPAPIQELHRISTIHPRTYSEAKTIGEVFRSGTPVIMNLGELDDADAKRLVDFAAGLIFGLRGSIERVTSKVFLLSPANVEVTPAEKERVPDRGFFNQS